MAASMTGLKLTKQEPRELTKQILQRKIAEALTEDDLVPVAQNIRGREEVGSQKTDDLINKCREIMTGFAHPEICHDTAPGVTGNCAEGKPQTFNCFLCGCQNGSIMTVCWNCNIEFQS